MTFKSAICTVLLAGLLMPLLTNCKKDAIKVPPTLTIAALTDVTSTTAKCTVEIPTDGGATITSRGVCWSSTNPTPTLTDSITSDGTGSETFTSSMERLLPGTTYNIRAYAINSLGRGYSSQAIFTTVALAPVMTTTELTDITSTSATGGGTITSDGGSAVTARGVCWSLKETPTIADTKTLCGSGKGNFGASITGLLPGTTYYFVAFATNGIGTAYGNQVTITTTAILPVVTTTTVSAITAASATTGGNVTSDGGAAITERGVCWSTTSSPTIANSKTTNGTGSGTFISTIAGLTSGTVYYIRAFATNSIGTAYGAQVTITTNALLPTLTTAAITAISTSTATSGGNIISDGGSSVTSRGVCWSTTENPTITNSKTNNGLGSGSFISAVTGLSSGTTYYIRSFATNSIGTAYGNQVTLTTTALLPTITTAVASSIMATTATSGGNITSDGGAAITARGVCWSTTQTPTTANYKTTDGTGKGIFASSVTGLTSGTTYYIRAYATNGIGTTYGAQTTAITIIAKVLPTLTTTVLSVITSTTATSGGNILNDGGASVTARGVCWGKSPDPTKSDSIISNGTGSGSFTGSITGLTPGTTYYFRSYATNSIGTAYGNQLTATTTAILPVISTTDVGAITTTTATSGGNITYDGGSVVTSRGVCYSTSQNPTIVNNKTTNGTSTGSFTSSITLLAPGTIYYFRAYATSAIGTAYGNQVTATTNTITATIPVITTTPVSAFTATTSTTGGNITSDGGATITARGVCWSTSSTPTTANSKTTNGLGSGVFASYITGLSPATIYYIRSYATNSKGTAYGNQLTTTTLTILAITTTASSSITANAITSGGNITTDGGTAVKARGVCYSTSQNPTISNSKTNNGTGKGIFASSITGLSAGTVYYIRAFAINNNDTVYGNQVTTTTNKLTATLPVITTTTASAITGTTATSGGNITSDGGASVTARGVCWSTTQNPTTANTKTTNGTGTGSFISAITALTQGTTYYIRAYATNSVGTAYGIELSFKTSISSGSTTVTDIDGNVYHTVTIGTQVWMVENLKTTKYRNGDPIPNIIDNTAWTNLTSGAYCWYNNDSARYNATYGVLYNWFTVSDKRYISPSGWHVPTDTEFTTLTNFLGGLSVAGGKIKESGTSNWLIPNNGATNSSGFTAVPGGYRTNNDGTFGNMRLAGYWWTSTIIDVDIVRLRATGFFYPTVQNYGYGKLYGFSIRCIKD